MKIIYVCNDLGYFLLHRQALAVKMFQEGHEVVLATGLEEGAEVPSALDGIEVHSIPLDRWRFNFLSDLKCIWQLLKLIREMEPQVVHAITIKANLLAGLASFFSFRREHFLVMTFAGLGRLFAETSPLLNRLQKSVSVVLLRLITSLVSFCATFENEDDETKFRKFTGASSDETVVIAGAGVDLSAFSGKNREGASTVIFAARLLKSKGVQLYINAAKTLNSSHSSVRFELAGPFQPDDEDGLERSELDPVLQQGALHYLGNLDSAAMAHKLAQVDILCLPTSYNEGFPRIVIEAMASGCFVIATNHVSLRNLIVNGQNGHLLEAATEEAVKAALQDALDDIEATRKAGQHAAVDIRNAGVSDNDVIGSFRRIYDRSKMNAS